ncbi:MAG: MBL fold metallo-hydrolase [Polyangiaceae bacterium]|nr:MBL fold metallo-hydrolase [Polyangiaceae bacterium]
MPWTVRPLVLSRFALDGGAMHGIVPKALWSRQHAPDADNRIALVARALLLEDVARGLRVVCEAGLGDRWSDKERRMYRVESEPLPAALGRAGVDPDTITHVLCTHLHWDHAAGLFVGALEAPELALPRALHVVSEASLRHAAEPNDKDAGSFHPAELGRLFGASVLRPWRPGEALLEGLEGRLSHGHTPGLLVVVVRERSDGRPLAFPADLVPTRSHLATRWVMAYDNEPVRVVAEKRELYAELVRIGGGLALYHDPDVEAAWPEAGAGEPKLVPGGL